MNSMLPMPEALARQLIVERTSQLRRRPEVRRHARTAVLLRRLAQRLDPQPDAAIRRGCPDAARRARAPRPWTAVPRPSAPHQR